MRRLTDSEMSQTIYLRSQGKSQAEIAKELNLCTASIGLIIKMFDRVKVCDWESVMTLISKNWCSLELVKWCCYRLGVAMPQEVVDCYEMTNKKRADARKKRLAEEAKKEEDKVIHECVVQEIQTFQQERKQDIIDVRDIKALTNAVVAVSFGIDRLITLAAGIANGEKIICDLLKQVKENNDLNCDILCSQIKKLGEKP